MSTSLWVGVLLLHPNGALSSFVVAAAAQAPYPPATDAHRCAAGGTAAVDSIQRSHSPRSRRSAEGRLAGSVLSLFPEAEGRCGRKFVEMGAGL